MSRKAQNRSRRTGVLVAAAASGVLATLSIPSAQAVVGDPAADNTYAYTARIVIGDSLRACTGALVDRRWVLTAASCFSDDPAQPQALAAGAPKWKSTVTIGAKSVQVAELVPRADRDLVMVRLTAGVDGIAPLPLATAAPTSGQTLRVPGFGRTKDEWVPGKLHTGAFSLDTVSPTGIGTTGTGGAAICKGDTGAPVIRETNGKAELVAVASRSWQGGCLGTPATETRTGAFNSRVDDLAGWMQQVKTSRLTSRLFAVGDDHQIWGNDGAYTENAWGTFNPVPGKNDIQQVSAVTMGDKVRLFVVGGDKRIWTTTGDYATGTWSPYDVVPNNSGIKQVTAVAMGNTVRLFAVGGDDRVYTAAGDYAAGGWTKFDPLPTSAIKQVAATTVGNTVRLFVIGGDSQIWTTTGDYTAGTWTPFVAVPSSGIQHIAVTAAGNTVRLFAVGEDRKVWTTESTDNGPWSTFGAVPNTGGIKQVAATTIGDTTRLFVIGSMDEIWTADKKADGNWTTFYRIASSSIQSIAGATTG
ncbi:trypsin-like serine protease [Kitasatospora sp. SUK 42]|uniref:trypsin-like serine protease n=1 Tax=Kitasatospora sp. SUK 42 TaxID=1588882 RepID=UPI001C317450|nr:trypsin-like serine protease [Kitasatospora sp. SUK 42]MBV2155625.1 S1 family peptidase [Kitasatospora sp. SUK 42]